MIQLYILKLFRLHVCSPSKETQPIAQSPAQPAYQSKRRSQFYSSNIHLNIFLSGVERIEKF